MPPIFLLLAKVSHWIGRLSALFCLCFGSVFLLGADAPSAGNPRLPTLFICGDSTAAPMHPPIQGWGERIGEFLDPARIRVENRAVGGRSARTFLAEGRWDSVRSQLRKGDIVFLQFGHNDTNSALSANRYDLPGIGNEVEEITDPRTSDKVSIHSYGFYLSKMVDEGLAAGASVIVLSSVPRNRWADGKIVRGEENHGPWAAAVAKAKGVPFVDANTLIADIYDPIAPPKLKALYFPQDNTHTNPAGARVTAAAIVQGLLQLKQPSFAAYLNPTAAAVAADIVAAVPKAAAEVKITLNLRNAFPTPSATNVCPDTPLRVTFATPPTLGSSGKIQIIDAADHTVVESIDVSSPTAVKDIGGLSGYKYYPVIIADNVATIYPKNGALAYNKTYYVTIDAGVFQEGADTFPAVDQPAAWRFTTKAAAPVAGTAKLTVSADGKGDFCTVQGALDFIPDGNTIPTTIFLRKGTYTEIVFFTNKHAITLLGEDRKQSVIAYATNDKFNPTSGNPFGSATPNPSGETRVSGRIYHRSVFLAHRVNNLTLAHLTVRNTTPHGGSQAEAIIFNGTPEARAIVKDVDLYSYQDTLQINGQAYLSGCYIEGDVDFMWGTGPCFFENCTARTVRSGAYYTQIRNPGTNHGYVYLHCAFDGAPGVTGNYFSRIEPHRFPHSEVVLIDCLLGASVIPVGWQLQGGAASAAPTNTADLHFWEFNSRTADDRPADVSQRLAVSRQLKQPDDDATIANYSNPTFVLGHDWDPKLAPIFK